ncbi:MAG: hypothetical protein H6741_07770 [Alphaproteobacteria bacterium]|nr:hypothetical protein [Alphaproteobacteria bacterium]
MIRAAFISSMLLAGACIPSTGVEAPLFSELTVPGDLIISPSIGYLSAGDGLATVAPMDFLVTNSFNLDQPMPDIQVEVISGFSGIYLFPSSAVSVVDRPASPDVSCSESWDPALCPWQDPATATYYNLANDYGAGDEDAYRPDYVIAPTNEHGILRVWAFIDQMPYNIDASALDSGGNVTPDSINWADAGITATLGHDAGTVTLSVDDS